jgi:hypothetical protein
MALTILAVMTVLAAFQSELSSQPSARRSMVPGERANEIVVSKQIVFPEILSHKVT